MVLASHSNRRGGSQPPASGAAASAPLKGELLSVAKLRGLHAHLLLCLTNKPLRLTFVRHLPFQGRQGHFVPAGGYEPPLRLAVRHDGYIPCNAQRPFPISIPMQLSQSRRKHYEKTDNLFYQ